MRGTSAPSDLQSLFEAKASDFLTAEKVEETVGLCLSGGGYRAMLYHVGALIRLNELGFLPQLQEVASVSGGSIAAGQLARAWPTLRFDAHGRACNFTEQVADPLIRFASVGVDIKAALLGLLPGMTAAGVVAAAYDRHLFRGATLQDIPDRPRFTFMATNLQTGSGWRFAKSYAADHRVGRINHPRLSLAHVVAASSAFPPYLSPMRLQFEPGSVEPMTGADLHRPPFTEGAVLTDGGVYDNLGLERVWRRCRTILVSNAGRSTPEIGSPTGRWLGQAYRSLNLIQQQAENSRKRILFGVHNLGQRKVAFWSIDTPIRAWFSIVSREVDNRPDANADFEQRRAERYRRRVGVDTSGPLTVLGVALRLVDRDDGRLQAVAPSILEGFPLAKILPCFEAIAISSAVRGHADGWKGLKWLCYLNEVDPEPTAEALRTLSAEIGARTPEAGIHPELPARAAALLLWLSGHEADEERAGAINPGIDQHFTYEKDYLRNPSRSFFALERRHAAIALDDKKRPLRSRLQRTSRLWLDPTFQPPPGFVDELRADAASFDVTKLHREMGRTAEDWLFEELEPVLARCAPDLLAELVRRKVQGFASCPPESRYWSAIHAAEPFILVGIAEASAAQALRLSAHDEDESQEAFAASELLKIELQSLADAQSQFDRLIAANLKFIPADFAEIMRPPSREDVDALIDRYGGGSVKQKRDLVVLLSVHPIDFSDSAWSWLTDLADQDSHDLHGVLFRMLTLADAARFGHVLATKAWGWNPSADLWVNHYGTEALIRAEPALPFDQLAPRLAPWRLLEAVRMRGADPTEVRLAAEVFGHVLAGNKIAEPDPGSTLTVDRTQKRFTPFVISVQPRPSPEEPNDPAASLRAALDADARAEAHKRAFETATARIDEARRSGASLYLTNVDAIDVEPVIRHASDLLEHWLEGSRDVTVDFRRRVRLAETTFLALCEALLSHDPVRGAALWRALRVTMATRFVGAAGIDELLHVVFRAPDSDSITALREEIISLPLCHTDRDLFDVVAAASYNGKAAWIAEMAAEDRASPLVWRQRRGVLLEGLGTADTLPVVDAWPDGQMRTDSADLRRKAARLRWREACARHWWRAYLAAQDPAEAYAAWILFLRSADARAWTWMRDDVEAQNASDDFFALKLAHVQLNRPKLKRAMEKRLDKRDKKFLDHDIVVGIGPWGKASDAI